MCIRDSFTSDKVLNVCQSLYEGKGKGGYITYPRTDSVYLEESLTDKASQTLNLSLIHIFNFFDNKICEDATFCVDSHKSYMGIKDKLNIELKQVPRGKSMIDVYKRQLAG